MKKIIALLLVFFMSGALLAGCGESGSENSSSTQATANKNNASDESETSEDSTSSGIVEPSPSFVNKTLKTVTETLPDGSVNSITEYDEQGNMTSYSSGYYVTYFNSKGEIIGEGSISPYAVNGFTTHEYDDNGNETIRKTYYGTSDSGYHLSDEQDFSYDEHGNETSRVATSYDDDGEIHGQSNVESYSYTYDENGNIVSSTKTDSDGFVEYSYNNDGLVDIEKDYDSHIDLLSWTQYEYDSEDRVIKETVYKSDDTLDYTREYTYDQFGNIVKQVTIDSKGKEKLEIERTYDYCNNITFERIYDYDGNATTDYTCEYTYDDAGNMTQKVLQKPGGKTIYTYENEYYD